MTITFPRVIPDIKYTTADMILDDPVKASESGGRFINYTQLEDPVWRVNLVTSSLLLQSQYAAVEAWWLSLREGLRTVLFRHPHSCYPIAHETNHGPADDNGSLVSVTDGNILAVSGVDPGLTLTPGDRLGVQQSGKYYIGRVTEVAGSGTTRTITVEPPLFDSVAQAGAVVVFAKPALVMRSVPGSFQPTRNGRFFTVTFQLRESQV
ncbi:hypothetical protein EV128_12243 [Rhizobium azibense]|nr:hypothetical protein EV128_12243 [Rhizobium azibense]